MRPAKWRCGWMECDCGWWTCVRVIACEVPGGEMRAFFVQDVADNSRALVLRPVAGPRWVGMEVNCRQCGAAVPVTYEPHRVAT